MDGVTVYSQATDAERIQIRVEMMKLVRASVLRQNRGRNLTFTELETITRALVDEALAKETHERTENIDAQSPSTQ